MLPPIIWIDIEPPEDATASMPLCPDLEIWALLRFRPRLLAFLLFK